MLPPASRRAASVLIHNALSASLGSVRTEMVGGNVETVTTYGPYGTLLAQAGTSGTAYGFTGEQYDSAAGLLYLRARYYNPYLNQFQSRDPFPGHDNLPQSQNGYSYADNNPGNYTDPTGLARIKIWVSAFIEPALITFPYPYAPPLTDFQAQFEGDDRSFYSGGPVRPSARVWHKVVLDTSSPYFFIVSNNADTGVTRAYYTDIWGNSGVDAAKAPAPNGAGIAWEGEVIFVGLEAHSGNPLTPPGTTPDIDYAYNFVFDLAKGEVGISGLHDWFPWHEVYIEVNGVPIFRKPVKYSPSAWPENPLALAYLPQPVNYHRSVPALKEDSLNYCVFTPASISYSDLLVGPLKGWYDLLGIGR